MKYDITYKSKRLTCVIFSKKLFFF